MRKRKPWTIPGTLYSVRYTKAGGTIAPFDDVWFWSDESDYTARCYTRHR